MGSKEDPKPCQCRKDSREVLSTEMYLAAKRGNLKKVRQYLIKGHDVNALDEDSCSLLASACIAGRLEVVSLLHKVPELHRNIDDWTGDTPLMHAARMGHKNVVKELLTCPHMCRLNVDVMNNYQDTAASIAVSSNHEDIAKLIRETKLPEVVWDPQLLNGLMPLRLETAHITFECGVCLEEYDTKERRPRSLSCGHTVCTTCITRLIGGGRLECPICRRPHASRVSQASDVPVNYAIDEVLQQQQQQQELSQQWCL